MSIYTIIYKIWLRLWHLKVAHFWASAFPLGMYMCIYCMFVCLPVCLFVCPLVRTCACIHICKYVWIFGCVWIHKIQLCYPLTCPSSSLSPHVFSCNYRFLIGEWARRLKAQRSQNVCSTLNSLHRISTERMALHALADYISNTTTERFNVYKNSWAQWVAPLERQESSKASSRQLARHWWQPGVAIIGHLWKNRIRYGATCQPATIKKSLLPCPLSTSKRSILAPTPA